MRHKKIIRNSRRRRKSRSPRRRRKSKSPRNRGGVKRVKKIIRKSRRRRKSNYKPAEFEMSNALINGFQRKIPKPMDCVINALQLMGALPVNCAELMRIVAGDGGFQKDQIEDTFRYLFPSKSWKFSPFSNLNELGNYTTNLMKNGTVVFCGYQGYNPTVKKSIGHVFLVGKDISGTPLYLDPQIPTICNLSDPQCTKYLSGKNAYFILEYCCGSAIKVKGGGQSHGAKRRRSKRRSPPHPRKSRSPPRRRKSRSPRRRNYGGVKPKNLSQKRTQAGFIPPAPRARERAQVQLAVQQQQADEAEARRRWLEYWDLVRNLPGV